MGKKYRFNAIRLMANRKLVDAYFINMDHTSRLQATTFQSMKETIIRRRENVLICFSFQTHFIYLVEKR